MFRELIMPHYKRGLDWIHENTNKKVFMHNDGAIFGFLDASAMLMAVLTIFVVAAVLCTISCAGHGTRSCTSAWLTQNFSM